MRTSSRGAAALLILTMAACAKEQPMEKDDREAKVGKPIEVVGTAVNEKLGAMIEGYWLDGVDAWPAADLGKRVRVTGTLIRRDDLPVFRQPKKGEPVPQGIPVEEGQDLEKAKRRYLIGKPAWKRVD